MRYRAVFILFSLVMIVAISANQSATKDNSKEIQDNHEAIIAPKNEVSEFRKKSVKGGGMMMKFMPMMIIPFLISSAMVPMALMTLKLMLFQSMLIGKVAIILMIISMFRNRGGGGEGGVFTHNLHANERDSTYMAHYGYTGGEEYGSYINK